VARNRRFFEEAVQEGANAAWDQDWDRALQAYQRALAEFPNDVSALTGLGLAYSGRGQLDSALESYQRASKLAPDDPVLYEHIGKAREQLGQGQEAAAAYLASAERYLNRQQAPHLALERWQDAVRADPACLQAHVQLLKHYHRHGQVREAVKECLTLARISQALGQHENAIQACNYALKLAPHDPEVLAALDDLRYGAPAAIEAGAGAPQAKPGLFTAPGEPAGLGLLDFEITPVAESEERGSPIEITRQKALADLAESLFEEEEATGLAAVTSRLSKAQVDALIGRAIDCQTRGVTDEAISAYEQVIRAGTERPAVYFNLGLLYQEKTRFDAAIPQFERAVPDADYALGSHFALGECYRAQGRIDQALKHFVEMLKIVDLATIRHEQADDLLQLYEDLADQTVTKGGREQALQFTNSLSEFFSAKEWKDRVVQARRQLDVLTQEGPVLSLAEVLDTPNSGEILESVMLGQQYADQGMCYTALEECYHALRRAPTYLPVHRQLAQVLMTMGKMDEAAAKLVVIANTYRMRGETHPAVALYRQALKLAPMDTGVRAKLIDLLTSQGEIDEALEHYMTLADSYYHLAQIDQARETYQEALRLAHRGSPERHWNARILHKIGDICLQRVDWRRAIEVYEQIRKLAPDDERARSALVDLYYRLNRPELAIAELDSLLKIYHKSGKTESVFAVLDDMVRQRPGDIPLRTRLAQAHLDAGNAGQALEHLDRLGDLQLEARRYEDARATIRAIIALQPPNVAEYQQLLDQLDQHTAN